MSRKIETSTSLNVQFRQSCYDLKTFYWRLLTNDVNVMRHRWGFQEPLTQYQAFLNLIISSTTISQFYYFPHTYYKNNASIF